LLLKDSGASQTIPSRRHKLQRATMQRHGRLCFRRAGQRTSIEVAFVPVAVIPKTTHSLVSIALTGQRDYGRSILANSAFRLGSVKSTKALTFAMDKRSSGMKIIASFRERNPRGSLSGGRESRAQVARSLGVDPSTLRRLLPPASLFQSGPRCVRCVS
jgi:hypothetical protein